MSDQDVTRQGVEDTTDQDVFGGMDLEPVTAKAPEQGGHTDSRPEPTPEPKAKVEEGKEEGAVTNAAAKDRRITEKKTKVTQEDWQITQEALANTQKELAQMRLEKDQAKFEAKNPIVTSEQYATKWEELCKAKADPENKYHRLDFSDLRKLLLDDEVMAENIEAEEEFETSRLKPILTPSGSGSGGSQKKPGGVDPDTYAWLKAKGYSDKEIEDSSNDVSLTGSRRR